MHGTHLHQLCRDRLLATSCCSRCAHYAFSANSFHSSAAFSASANGATPARSTTPVTRFFSNVTPPVVWLVPASNRLAPAATSSTCSTATPTCRRPSRHTTTMTVSYTHLRAHETDSYLVCRL